MADGSNESKQEQSTEDILDELEAMYQNVKPDSETIEGDEDLADEISMIDAMLSDTNTSTKDKLSVLIRFNTHWFPDGLTKSEQIPYRKTLLSASELFTNI